MSEPWIPEPDAASAPFFDGAREGRLMLQRCADCARWLHPVRERCPSCGSTRIEWHAASGRGTLYSHGRLHRAYHPRHTDRLPLTLAVVDLDEGVRMNTNLVGDGCESPQVGAPVEVGFEHFPDGGAIPVFRLR